MQKLHCQTKSILFFFFNYFTTGANLFFFFGTNLICLFFTLLPPPHPHLCFKFLIIWWLFKNNPKQLHELFMLSICLEISPIVNEGNESWVTHLGEILRCGYRMGKLQGGSYGCWESWEDLRNLSPFELLWRDSCFCCLWVFPLVS